ncbi:hypothetical protein MY1884_007786 [Beauveria asiatica]
MVSSDSSSRLRLEPKASRASYSYDTASGWRRWRVLRPGRGMYHDVKRRIPYYWSDITDAFIYRTIASTVRMYFVNLLPAIAYTLDMYRRTGHFFGINESLLSSALAAVVFSILSAQPLTIVGVTGLISLFNFTIYDIIRIYDGSIYPQFMAWTGIWAAIFHWLVAIFNGCDYMRYVTDFSSESFGLYVGIIYIVKGVEELINEFENGNAAGFLACIIGILYFASVYALEKVGSGTMWKEQFRGILADYSYVLCTVFWVGFSHIPGHIRDSNIERVPVTKAFYPTQSRSWIIDFWTLDVKWAFVAMPFGFLLMLLFYYDHNVSSITAQARRFPLKKPGGFHWDFFLLGCTTFVAAILGLPMPNGLVPQVSAFFWYSLTVYKTELKIVATSEGEDTEIRRPVVTALAVVEQRISHLMMGLALIGTMTGPLLTVLHTMPSAVFAGVFFVVGWGSIESNGILQKFLYLQAEKRFVQRDEPILHVRRRKISLYIGIQFLGVAACVAISHTLAAIGFPLLIIILIPLRIIFVPRWFTLKELQILDDFTTTNKMVLASLGGKPALPEETREDNWGLERRRSEQRHGVVRQRAGSLHR